MTEAKVTFIYDCNNIIIQCKKEERMKDICQRCSTKLGINLNLSVFLYPYFFIFLFLPIKLSVFIILSYESF